MNVVLDVDSQKNMNYGLECFFEISVDLMAIISKEQGFIKVSNSFKELLGWNLEEIISQRWDKFVHQDDIDEVREILKINMGKNEFRGLQLRYKCKDGEFKWVECNYKYMEAKEIYIVTATDITDKKKREEERVAFEKAMELENIKSEFFSNISHEFKTPLNIILTTMQLINKNIELKNIVSKEEVHLNKYMNSIRQNCYRLLRLVNNIIDMSKIDSGYYNIHLGNYNIVSIVEDITMSVIEYGEEKGINLIFDTEMEEEIIACDPDKIERIILNLLSNAIKYTKEDGLIAVNIEQVDNYICIHVKDSGIGIPREKLDNIFERYAQVDNKLTRKCNGSGIGLSLVKSLVEMQGGDIYAESIINEGSIFTIKLPIVTVEGENKKSLNNDLTRSKVEKCSIEFADIYS